jgi:hypothetical protein
MSAIALAILFVLASWAIPGFLVGAGWHVSSVEVQFVLFGAIVIAQLGRIGDVLHVMRKAAKAPQGE